MSPSALPAWGIWGWEGLQHSCHIWHTCNWFLPSIHTCTSTRSSCLRKSSRNHSAPNERFLPLSSNKPPPTKNTQRALLPTVTARGVVVWSLSFFGLGGKRWTSKCMYVCTYACMCVLSNICMYCVYTKVYMYIHVYYRCVLSTYMYAHMYTYVCTCVCTYVLMCTCVLSTYMYVLCMYVYVCVYVYTYGCTNVCCDILCNMYVRVCACVYMYVRINVMYICMYIRVVCVYIWLAYMCALCT